MRDFAVSVVAGAGILVVSVLMFGLFLVLRPSAERVEAEVVATPVEVVSVTQQVQPAVVQANGTVQPAQRVALVPEVSGRITWVHEDLAPGARFDRGEVFARIDARDYELAVRVEESRVHQAELELELELGRQKVAAREWELLRKDKNGEENGLALRKPQLETMKRAVDAAKSGLERAQLALERTRLRAPFNAVVTVENLDVGQVVGPGSTVAQLVGTDRFWVHVAIPVEDLGWLDLDGDAIAEIRQELGDGSLITREGRVERLGGELDPQTRTATVIVAIDEPMKAEGLPLLPGAYVEVEMRGRQVDDVFEVPRRAVVDGRSLLVATPEGTLDRRDIEVAWGDGEWVSVRGELSDGDKVITSAIAAPIVGMPVKVVGETVGAAEPTEDRDEM